MQANAMSTNELAGKERRERRTFDSSGLWLYWWLDEAALRALSSRTYEYPRAQLV